MQKTSKMKYLADLGAVHGLSELFDAGNRKHRSMWIGYMLLSLFLLISVLFNISRQFYRSEPISSASYLSPKTFPVLYVCPARIPMSAIAKAGYTGAVAEFLQNLPSISTYTSSIQEHLADVTYDAQSITDNVTVQSVLLDVGKHHFELLNIIFRGTIAKMVSAESEQQIVLAPSGYCSRFITVRSMWPLPSIVARQVFLTVKIRNLVLMSEMGGFYVAVQYHENEVFLPSSQLFNKPDTDMLYNFLARWETKLSLKSSSIDCDTKWHSRDQCLATCLSEIRCKSGCQLYSTTRKQKFSDLCVGAETKGCLKGIFESSNCSKACRKPCKQQLFHHRMTAVPVVKNRSEEDMDVIELNMMTDSPESSLATEEAPSVTSSLYFVYVGGNLGVFFGINALGVIVLIRHALFFESFCVMAMGPFAASLSSDFFLEQKTKVQLYSGGEDIHPKVYLSGPGVSESKLHKLLSLNESFWIEEKERLKSGNNKPPFMCDFVNGLQWANPLLKQFEIFSPEVRTKAAELSSILSTDDFVKTHGLQQLLVEALEDPEDFITKVVDQLGRELDYSAKPVLATMTVLFELTIEKSEICSSLIEYAGTYTIRTRRYSVSENKCRMSQEWRGIVVANDYRPLGFSFDYFPFFRVGDVALKIRPIRVQLKTRRHRPCVENNEDVFMCISACYQRKHPCKCKVLGYGMGGVDVRNVSGLCHRFQPFTQQCQLMRVMDSETMKECERACPQACLQTKFSYAAYPQNAKDPDVQTVTVVMEKESVDLHLKETYAYDLILYLCNVGGLISCFFGYSFISLFKTVIRR